jgi:hypothetical protein
LTIYRVSESKVRYSSTDAGKQRKVFCRIALFHPARYKHTSTLAD